jgi:hypothetical protein
MGSDCNFQAATALASRRAPRLHALQISHVCVPHRQQTPHQVGGPARGGDFLSSATEQPTLPA